jgi:hypothetical protein
MGMDFASKKISYFFLQNPIPIKWFFAKSNLFLLHFLWALLVRKLMDGRERGRFYRGGNGGEAVIKGRDVDKNLRIDPSPSII